MTSKPIDHKSALPIEPKTEWQQWRQWLLVSLGAHKRRQIMVRRLEGDLVGKLRLAYEAGVTAREIANCHCISTASIFNYTARGSWVTPAARIQQARSVQLRQQNAQVEATAALGKRILALHRDDWSKIRLLVQRAIDHGDL